MRMFIRALCCSALLGMQGAALADSITYSERQAELGKKAYDKACAVCHLPFGATGVVPVLVDESFKTRWAGRRVSELFTEIKRMPPGMDLGDDVYAAITAYLLQVHGVEAGSRKLPDKIARLEQMVLPVAADAVPTHTVAARPGDARLAALRPVTTEILQSPSPEAWPGWGRSNNRNGFTPLGDINKNTIDGLQTAWSLDLAFGNNNPTPLVHDGVMFFYTFPDTVMALDATNGELLWRYRHDPRGAAPMRKMGIALGGDKIFVPTSDMRMLALDIKSGEVAWETEVVYDRSLDTNMGKYNLRAAPLVAGDKVIMGVVSSIVPTGGFIFALDTMTGEEAWRFRTIAQPGTPGGDSWNGLAAAQRSGGSVWNAGSYDPELGLVYFGIAPTYDVRPLQQPTQESGHSREAKYTNGTVALNAESGELRWHFGHHVLDHWDLDWAMERQLLELNINGKTRKALVTVSKGAILDALDAASGEYLYSIDPGIQTTISDIDPDSGAKHNNPGTEPGREGTYLVCPTAFGARSWTPASVDPNSKLMYQPFIEACFSAGGAGGPLLLTGINVTSAIWPGSEGKIGRLHAFDLEKGGTRWLHRQEAPIVSSTLATAGGLVFAGDLEPSLKAFDAATGELVWQTPLRDDPSTSIISYAVDGKQYLALVVGQSNNHHRDWKRFYDGTFAAMKWARPAPVKGAGPSIQVFALKK